MKKARFLVIAALALLSSTAFAEGNVAQIGKNGTGGSFETLEAALNAVANADTVYLLQDVTISEKYILSDGSVKNINMNDKKMFCTVGGYSNPAGGAFEVQHGTLSFCGTGTFRGAGALTGNTGLDSWVSYIKLKGSLNASDENYSVLNIGKDITFDVNGENWNPIGISGNNDNTKHSYGVVVNFYGKIVNLGGWYAFSTSGNIQDTDGSSPVVNITDAEITIANSPLNANEVALYAAGYATWNITNTTMDGATCIYSKAGTINIINSTITANGTYVEDPQAISGGCASTGDAIFLDSKVGYAGCMSLNISGNDTEISSVNGHAIREDLTDMQETSTIALTITSGTFVGNAERGAIKYSDEFRQALIDGSSSETWTLNGITGGNFSSNPLACADNYVAVESSTGGFTVKPATEAPQPGEKVYITSATTVDNLTVPTNTEIIVQTGATYTVGQVLNVTADLSKVTVQPGGTLIAGSIVSDSTHQFVVESDLTYGTGVVKYTSGSEVASPKGTVQLAVAAKQLSANEYKFQHFGIPTTSLPAITKNNVPAAYSDWDRMQGWIYNGGSSSFTEPFVGHNVTVQADEAGTVFTFSGDVVTNQNAEFTLNRSGYTALANSYTAPMDIQAIHNSLEGVQTDKELWIYFANADTIGFTHVGPDYYELPNPKVTKLPVMQGFFLGNEGSETDFTVTYAEAMSDGDTKDAAADVVDGGVISLSDGSRSAELMLLRKDSYEGISGSKQFETAGNLQIYVKEGDNKWATFKANSFDNQFIEIVTQGETEYTLTFSRLANDAFALYDITDPNNEKQVKVSEGGTYSFTAPANQTVKYFRLGTGHLTGAEEAEATELNFWVSENTLYVAGAESDIVVYNAAGVKVAAAKADGNAIQAVNIASLANGLYIVESGALTGKFIK